jgi:flagellar motor switch protein FliN/FliY
MDVATALRPALEAAAATLGRVRVSAERVEDVVAALDGLRDKGMFVAVPLLAGGVVEATFALQVTLPEAPRERRGSLDLLRNVAMEVTVEIGRTRMTVQELLSLYPGEVIELDRAASAPADLLVNGTLIARGEIVVVDEDFGLRISEIVTDASEFGHPTS